MATSGGDVAMTTSGRGTVSAACVDDSVKPKNAAMRPAYERL